MKGGHKEVPALAACRDEPVIPEPEVRLLKLLEIPRSKVPLYKTAKNKRRNKPDLLGRCKGLCQLCQACS